MRFQGCYVVFCHKCLKVGLRAAKLSEIFEICKHLTLLSGKTLLTILSVAV